MAVFKNREGLARPVLADLPATARALDCWPAASNRRSLGGAMPWLANGGAGREAQHNSLGFWLKRMGVENLHRRIG